MTGLGSARADASVPSSACRVGAQGEQPAVASNPQRLNRRLPASRPGLRGGRVGLQERVQTLDDVVAEGEEFLRFFLSSLEGGGQDRGHLQQLFADWVAQLSEGLRGFP